MAIDLTVLTVFNPWVDILPPPDVEIGGGDNLVETSGYVDKHAELSALFASGQSLDTYRKAMFPNMVAADDPNMPEYDPTGRFNYDFFDWHADVNFVRNQFDEATRLSNVDLKDADIVNQTTAPPPATTPVVPPQTS